MPLRIEQVKNSKDLHAFVTYPWTANRNDEHWVPPLIGETKKLFNPEKNPFFEHGEIEPYLARRKGKVVGRIAAIRNKVHEEFHQEPMGFFGFFDCEDDPEVAMGLFGAVREFLRARKLETMMGPVNPSTNEECGVLVEGFETPPMVMMLHNPPYYDSLIKRCGLSKVKDLLAFILKSNQVPERLEKGARLARKRNPDITIRKMDMKRFREEVDAFRTVYNGAWEKNWGFLPMTPAELDHMAKQLKKVMDPGLVRIAVHKGNPVGFALGLPDFNMALKHANGRLFPFGLPKILWYSRRIDRARIIALGILKEYRRTGLDVMLYRDVFKSGIEKGYVVGEFSWILEDNVAMVRPLEYLGAKVYKKYRLYQSAVDH